VRLRFTIVGDKVQNVGYRLFLRRTIKEKGLEGMPSNVGDGRTVSVIVYGEKKVLDEFYEFISKEKPIGAGRVSISPKNIDNKPKPSQIYFLNEKTDLMLEQTEKFVEVGKNIDRSMKGIRKDLKVLPKQIAKELKPIRVREHKRKLR
jgi:acylphosphatase